MKETQRNKITDLLKSVTNAKLLVDYGNIVILRSRFFFSFGSFFLSSGLNHFGALRLTQSARDRFNEMDKTTMARSGNAAIRLVSQPGRTKGNHT